MRLPDAFDYKITAVQDTLFLLRETGVISQAEYEKHLLRPRQFTGSVISNNHIRKGWRLVQNAIINSGFDGVIYENNVEGDGESFIVSCPEQIRLLPQRH